MNLFESAKAATSYVAVHLPVELVRYTARHLLPLPAELSQSAQRQAEYGASGQTRSAYDVDWRDAQNDVSTHDKAAVLARFLDAG